ncbi:MAG: hypothetical protein DRP74_09325 [Candidatus Omnitrophota bacterium]|nr:MAG: hypothetical protein DRP74_09325 [Candidatus Omnitrophota bacterium]
MIEETHKEPNPKQPANGEKIMSTSKIGIKCANHIWDTSGKRCLICGKDCSNGFTKYGEVKKDEIYE